MPSQLTDREADIMRVLWENGPSTVAEVRKRLSEPLAYTSVQTFLKILEEKRFVGHVEEGRQHRFHALIAEAAARQTAVRHLVGKLFRGSSELLFTHLVADSKLTPAQIRRMRRILENQNKE